MTGTAFRRAGAALCLLSGMALSGCSFAPDYNRPEMDIPDTWSKAPYNLPMATKSLEVQWWKRFNDPVLDKLVEETLLHNQNLAAAIARVDQARAYLGLARSEFFPTLAGSGSAGRAEATEGDIAAGTAISKLFGMQGFPMDAPGRVNNQFSLGLQAVWEMDLWGKVRNSTAAAREQLLASEAGQRGVVLSLAGQTASAYISLRSYDAQLSIAKRTLASREEALKIYRARYDEGLISELDFLRAKTEVDSVRASLYTAQYQVATAESALMVLTGRSPRDIFEASPKRGLELEAMPSAPQLPVGMPSDLLERRPELEALFFTAAGVHGGCRAVEESGRRLKIITFDEVPTTLNMLKKGVISATISQQPFQQGSRSLDLLFACLTSGTVPEREQYFVEHSIRIRENYRTPQIR